MSRYLFTLYSAADRDRAIRTVQAAPIGSRVEVKAEKRSLDQNSKLWAMLSEIAHQLPWHGQKLTPNSWKLLFLDALKREMQLVPNLDNTGFVNIRQSSSDLSKAEMGDLLELITEFGVRHGVAFHDREQAA